MQPEETQNLAHWFEVKKRQQPHIIVLNRKTCDWVIDVGRDTAICRTHGEMVDGVDSKHFPGNSRKETT